MNNIIVAISVTEKYSLYLPKENSALEQEKRYIEFVSHTIYYKHHFLNGRWLYTLSRKRTPHEKVDYSYDILSYISSK